MNTKELNMSTKFLYGAWSAEKDFGAMVTPIYQNSTFAYDNAGVIEAVFAGKQAGYVNSRVAESKKLFMVQSQKGIVMNLSEKQVERYSRHIILPEVGGEGQKKLLAGKILIVGAGGLGSPAALYLAAAGVGTIGIIDGDLVDLSNLQRQIAHSNADLGKPKAISAAEAMQAINEDVNVRIYQERLTAENALNVIKDYDFIIDGTDNIASKFLVADACHFAGKPYSHAGILRFEGQAITVKPGETTCYRCIFGAPPPAGAVSSCSQAGALGVLAGVIGTIQATEAIKFILGIGDLLANKLLVYNALKMSFRLLEVRRNVNCPLCGANPAVAELIDEEQAVCDLNCDCMKTR